MLVASQAMEAFQTAADYYQGEESTTQANQCLLKVADFAATSSDFKKAVEIYEQVRPARKDPPPIIVLLEGLCMQSDVMHLVLPADIHSPTTSSVLVCRWRSAAWRTTC